MRATQTMINTELIPKPEMKTRTTNMRKTTMSRKAVVLLLAAVACIACVAALSYVERAEGKDQKDVVTKRL